MRPQDPGDREMRDRHASDEAAMRQEQQRAAGPQHRPVEDYPPLGHRSAADADPDRGGGLAGQYEAAVEAERVAWEGLQRGAPSAPRQAWEQWRHAVDARERATRMLINHYLATG